MFWIGLICGLFIGFLIGLLTAAMCVAADAKYDHPEDFKLQCIKFEDINEISKEFDIKIAQ